MDDFCMGFLSPPPIFFRDVAILPTRLPLPGGLGSPASLKRNTWGAGPLRACVCQTSCRDLVCTNQFIPKMSEKCLKATRSIFFTSFFKKMNCCNFYPSMAPAKFRGGGMATKAYEQYHALQTEAAGSAFPAPRT